MIKKNVQNETTMLSKTVSEMRSDLEQIKSVVYAAKEVLNLTEAAAFLGITKSCLYKMTHTQAIPFYKPNNKMVYFEKVELLKWLRRNPIASKEQISEEASSIMRKLALKE